jgi:hypothetical protein
MVWSQVPARIATRLLPLGRFGVDDKRAFWSLDWDGVLGRLSTGKMIGLTSEEGTARRRAVGYVVALDHVLVSELPIKLDQGAISYPYEYFPHGLVIPSHITDPGLLETKLHDLISGDLSDLAAKVPSRFQSPEAVDGLRVRALLLLGSTSTSARTLEVLQKAFAEGPPQARGAAAAALAFAGREDAMREVLSVNGEPSAKTQLLSALTRDGGKYWVRIDGEQVHSAWGSVTDVGRSLDPIVVDLSYRDPDPEVRQAAMMALVCRQDNPEVRTTILDHLNRSTDPLLAYNILDAGLVMSPYPEFCAYLVRQLDSPSPMLRNLALSRVGGIRDPAIIDRIIPYLDDHEWAVRILALMALEQAGRMQPEKAIGAIQAALSRRPNDPRFREDAHFRLESLSQPPRNIASLREWLREHPDHELR